MQYTAIVKDGGLFIPNITSDVDIVDANVEVYLELPPTLQQVQKTSSTPAKTHSKAESIMSFAGSWQDLDQDILSSAEIEQRRRSVGTIHG